LEEGRRIRGRARDHGVKLKPVEGAGFPLFVGKEWSQSIDLRQRSTGQIRPYDNLFEEFRIDSDVVLVQGMLDRGTPRLL
jgi:hypothetical protein